MTFTKLYANVSAANAVSGAAMSSCSAKGMFCAYAPEHSAEFHIALILGAIFVASIIICTLITLRSLITLAILGSLFILASLITLVMMNVKFSQKPIPWMSA